MSREVTAAASSREDAEVTRDKNVVVRLNAEEVEQWQSAAARSGAGRSLSDWIRLTCNAATKRDHLTEQELEEMLARGEMIPADAPGAERVLQKYLAGKIKVKHQQLPSQARQSRKRASARLFRVTDEKAKRGK